MNLKDRLKKLEELASKKNMPLLLAFERKPGLFLIDFEDETLYTREELEVRCETLLTITGLYND